MGRDQSAWPLHSQQGICGSSGEAWQFVAEEHHASDLYLLQQADHAAREGLQVLLPKLPPGLRLALREVQEVLQEVQMYQLRF
jgi:hypothetical protein